MFRVCTKCYVEFPATPEFFHYKPRGEYGLNSRCKKCAIAIGMANNKKRQSIYNARNRARYAANPEKYKAQMLKSRNKYRDKVNAGTKRWRSKNVEKVKVYRKLYIEKNRHMFNEYARRRKHGVKKATPLWASREKILLIYKQATEMRAAGEDVHVDHVIPLGGKTVCGLHVETNLQIIPAVENHRKRHSFA